VGDQGPLSKVILRDDIGQWDVRYTVMGGGGEGQYRNVLVSVGLQPEESRGGMFGDGYGSSGFVQQSEGPV